MTQPSVPDMTRDLFGKLFRREDISRETIFEVAVRAGAVKTPSPELKKTTKT